MKPDMSPKAVTRRLQRVSELVRACRALAGPRRKPTRPERRKMTVKKSRHDPYWEVVQEQYENILFLYQQFAKNRPVMLFDI